MLKKLSLLVALLLASCSPAMADAYGNGVIPVGPTRQAAATGTSSTATLTTVSNYVLVWNEGAVFAYVTCTGAPATVPGGSASSSTPVGPLGGIILQTNQPTAVVCAAITAGTAAIVDFTPVNLF